MPYQVAKDVVAYCTSCRMNLVHIIVAMEGEKIARVLCKTCKREHAYKPPKGVADLSRSNSKRASSRQKGQNGSGDWEEAMKKIGDLPAKGYVMDGLFEEGDKLDHKTFGMGIVQRLIKPNKMEVLFKENIKLLIRGDGLPS